MTGTTAAPTKNNAALGLLLGGAVALVVGAIALVNRWQAASMRIFTDGLYGMPPHRWTAGVVTSIVLLALGVLLLILGTVRWERHPEQGPPPPD
jgi:uncharacterized membrane protein YidH (DUF202 family)